MDNSIQKIMELDGTLGACIVDGTSGMMLASESKADASNALNLELAAASSSDVMRAQKRAMSAAADSGQVEDILVTLPNQYHLLRPLEGAPSLYLYVVIDRRRGNLALARHVMAQLTPTVQLL